MKNSKQSHKTSTADAYTAEKRAFALALRKQGHSYEAIGRLLGTQFKHLQGEETFSAVYASKLVKDAIKDIYREEAKDMIVLECERLDALQLEALQVLQTKHVMISNGAVVRVHVKDEKGNLQFDPSTGLPLSVPLEDDGPKLAAIDRLVKIQESRRKLLGLDKPTKTALTDPDGKKAVAPFQMLLTPDDVKI